MDHIHSFTKWEKWNGRYCVPDGWDAWYRFCGFRHAVCSIDVMYRRPV